MQKQLDLSVIQFRLFQETDSVEELNALLRAAYQPLAAAGMKFAASHENVEATKRNIQDGECYIAELDNQILSCAVLRIPNKLEKVGWKANGPSWYQNPIVTTFGRFAVLPELKGQGLGSKMMDVLEARAKALGFSELALDTSEHAKHLIEMYDKRKYRFIEYHQWNITNYRSVVMSKTL